jgi:glycosyltransferase involved in cell wall biosynthesis
VAIDSRFPEVWENNPNVVEVEHLSPSARIINCEYDLVNDSNVLPYHVIHAFPMLLNSVLGIKMEATTCKGDIHLSQEEKGWYSQVHELTGEDMPYWVVATGGKSDATTKFWPPERFQQVIDHFYGKIQFVQVGENHDLHPDMKRVMDFRGRTSVRELIRLVYHAQGVVCPITSLMHLAAAVETRPGRPRNRSCVVIAGGREPSHWEAYPHHQFIHTNGALLCCDQGGCWKSRVRPLGDGSPFDLVENLCVSPGKTHARCMELISVQHVIRRFEYCFSGGNLEYLDPISFQHAEKAVAFGEAVGWSGEKLEWHLYRIGAEQAIAHIPTYPQHLHGRGIVICAGGVSYFANAWVCIKTLRSLGCKLPIQVWHLGEAELDREMEMLLEPLGVKCVDALKVASAEKAARLNGWSLKSFALVHSPFVEVLLLDADNVPATDPEYLFEDENFTKYGAVFWPDIGSFSEQHPIWEISGVEYIDEPQFESGQILIDKRRGWRALNLAMWYNENFDFFYQYIHGDKDTYHMAFLKLGVAYKMPPTRPKLLKGAMCQYDFQGKIVFQHRNSDRWNLDIAPRKIEGFLRHKECCAYIGELKKKWRGVIKRNDGLHSEDQEIEKELVCSRYKLSVGETSRYDVVFFRDGKIDSNGAHLDWRWRIENKTGVVSLNILTRERSVCRLDRINKRLWRASGSTAAELKINNQRMEGTIWFKGPINTYTGFGLHATQIVADLLKAKFDVKVTPYGTDEKFSKIPRKIRSRFVYEENNSGWELVLSSPGYRPVKGRKTVLFTMWESTELPRGAANFLNQAEALIVPCQWNVEVFRRSGVTIPIFQVPLGINTKLFRFSPPPLDGPCIFGTAGRTAVGGVRKGMDIVLQAFLAAFPTEEDVKLYIKGFPDCDLPDIADPRVIVTKEYLSPSEMARWYESITCFVSGARGEGWGLMQHQALATGRPLISIEYGGVKEFFHDRVGYPANYRLLPAQGHYANCGEWAEPDLESLIQRLRQVHADRDKALALGKKGAEEVSKWSWHRSNKELLNILKRVGMIS